MVGGDRPRAAIAAASVLATVTRDRYMREGAAATHPGWGFDEHVGYSTPEHRAAIDRQGISPLHRRSFASVAYTQLGLDGGYDVAELNDDLLEDELGELEGHGLEGSDEVVEVENFVLRAEDDADGVEADLGVARDRAA